MVHVAAGLIWLFIFKKSKQKLEHKNRALRVAEVTPWCSACGHMAVHCCMD